MSVFSTLMQASSVAVDSVMAERLRLVPMAASQYGASLPDGAREVTEVDGVFRYLPARVYLTDGNQGRDFDQSAAVARTFASIDRAALGDGVWRGGDRVVRLQAAGAPLYEIVGDPEADGATRVLLTLAAVVAA